MILLLTILWHSLEAIADGLYDKGKKTISSIVEFINKLVAIGTTAYVTYGVVVGSINIPVWKLIAGFVFIRFLIFDTIYNLTRGLPWNYVGSTKLYDKVLAKTGSWGWFLKAILGIVGIAFLLGLK